jgi:hypothetical protein
MEPLALFPADAAAALSLSKRSLSRLISAGKINSPAGTRDAPWSMP